MRKTALTLTFGKKQGLFLFILLILIPGLGPLTAEAQQTSLISQYMYANLAYNPGYAGASGGICANGLFRQQYIGFKDSQGNKGAPQTFFVTIDAPIRKIHGAVSASLMQDKIGFFTNIGLNLGYAYRTEIGAGDFSIGAQVILQNIKLDFSKFTDQFIDGGDPVLEQEGDQSDLIFDVALGAYYEVQDRYYIGLSSTQIIQSEGKNTHYRLRRTYNLTGGYNFVIPNHPVWEIKPSAILYFDGGAFQVGASALLAYNKKFYGGLGYRYQDAVIVLAGMNIKSFRVGLAYDLNTSKLTNYNSGSFEVMLGYCFKIETEKFRRRYKNTRYL